MMRVTMMRVTMMLLMIIRCHSWVRSVNLQVWDAGPHDASDDQGGRQMVRSGRQADG